MDGKLPIPDLHGSSVHASRQDNISNEHLSFAYYGHANPFAAATLIEAEPELVQDELAPHDSFLEYINSMLMDESFEDSSWQVFVPNVGALNDVQNSSCDGAGKRLSSCVSLNDRYEHIFRNFHEILDDKTMNPSAFESIETNIGADHKAVAECLDIPAGIPYSDFAPSHYLQQPEEDAHMEFYEYGSLVDMREVASEVRHKMTPTMEPDVQSYQHNAACHMADMRGSREGNYFESAAESWTRGGHHDGSFGRQLQVRETSVQMQENVTTLIRSEHYLGSYQPNEEQQLPSAMANGRAGPATQPSDAHTNDSQSVGPNHSVHIAKGQDVSLVRNADLPAELYAQLFDEWPRKLKGSAFSLEKTAGGRLPNQGRRDEALANPVDLKTLLLTSAKAVGEGNVKRAMEILQQIQQGGASPNGTGLERVVHYFTEAMMARLSGMGNTLYNAIANTAQLPSPLMMIKAYKMVFDACPYVKVAYHFANQYILKAASGASRLHIVDYGIFYGFQWPCLMYALAHRPEGPPFIRITGIEYPANPADINPTATTEGTSRRLREYAKTYNVPFEYHAISASKWEDIDASSLCISQDEVLVLNSFNRLGHIHDENTAHPSRRDQLLKQMRSLNAHLFVVGSMNAAHSSPFFAPRFREAFYYYSNMFDVLHTTMMNDSPERVMFERELMGRAILNVVACEGVERVEVPETYKQWQTRIERAGFRMLPIIPSVWKIARAVMKSYHKDFNLLQDSNRWVLLGWRGRSMQALAAWEPG